LTFKILSGTGESQHWAKVLDEAWERFDADPPERLAVVVSDLPGDDQLRKPLLVAKADRQVRGESGDMLYMLLWAW